MAKTDFVDDIISSVIEFKHKRDKSPWYNAIIDNLEYIHKRNTQNTTYHKLCNINKSEYLIYIVDYNDMYLDIKIYVPELKDCFLFKINCKINKTLLSVYEIVFEDLDVASKYINTELFKEIFTELENYSKSNKIFAINVYIKNFIAPYNKQIAEETKNMGYRLISTNIGTSMYKEIIHEKKTY